MTKEQEVRRAMDVTLQRMQEDAAHVRRLAGSSSLTEAERRIFQNLCLDVRGLLGTLSAIL